MSRVPCSRCENRYLTDELKPCATCLAPLCHECQPLHQAEKHFKEPERIVHKPAEKKEEKLWDLTPKKGKKHDDEHGSLADA